LPGDEREGKVVWFVELPYGEGVVEGGTTFAEGSQKEADGS
jgi:hypothetical protein